MSVESIMQEIQQLRGMDEFKGLCHRLQLAAASYGRHQMTRLPIPNLIFAAAPGCGTTLHIRLLSDLLKELRLLQFVGEEEYFEWYLGNGKEDFDKFLKRVRIAGGFYGQFHGVIGLDISDLLEERGPLPDMERLMEYVDARQGKIVFIFIVPQDTDKVILQQLLGRFASCTPAEIIRMPFPQDEALHYVLRRLQLAGFNVNDDAAAELEKAVPELVRAGSFEGYQTLQNLTDEIIWRKISREQPDAPQITPQDLLFITAEDGYCSRMNTFARRAGKRIIGFDAGSEDVYAGV